MNDEIPTVPAYGRQIFVCTNGSCARPETAQALLQHLEHLNRRHGRHQRSNPERIHAVSCGCLGVCMAGPILVVYPDGIWYRAVDAERLERIYREHLLAGIPVDEWVLHRHYPAGREPLYAPEVRVDAEVAPIQQAAERAAMENETEPLPAHVQAARQRRARRRRNQ